MNAPCQKNGLEIPLNPDKCKATLNIDLNKKYYLASTFMIGEKGVLTKLGGLYYKNERVGCDNEAWPGNALQFTIKQYEDGTYSFYNDEHGYLLNTDSKNSLIHFGDNSNGGVPEESRKWYVIKNQGGAHYQDVSNKVFSFKTNYEAWILYAKYPTENDYLYIGNDKTHFSVDHSGKILPTDSYANEYLGYLNTCPGNDGDFRMFAHPKCQTDCNDRSPDEDTKFGNYPVPFMIIPVANT